LDQQKHGGDAVNSGEKDTVFMIDLNMFFSLLDGPAGNSMQQIFFHDLLH
jgi:hypothetical protein